ncbi:hypothetical protein JKJ11_24020 [Vibrio sp. SCSIO 43133]|uniref:hypothetical protein n=1 Tax=Vibrio sp. SCSIO 43133 TaxID=2802577 RepID=UPI002075D917|nr:hypothetical protein [Vibrio sp. SCSIO 43133]USE02715.1 hypothetical protein JKJ11_24020 [Vibrio sp. SCSIO 43133]
MNIKILAREFRDEGKHTDAVSVGLDLLDRRDDIIKGKFRSADEFTEIFLNLSNALYSASDECFFEDFVSLFELYNSITSKQLNEEPLNGYFNHALVMYNNLKANLFCYYDKTRNKEELHSSIALLELWSKRLECDSNAFSNAIDLISIGRKALEGIDPSYTVSFRGPYALPVPDGDYKLNSENASQISIKTLKLDDLTSQVGDRYFSKITLTFLGFTSTDNYWLGPTSKNREASFNISKCLKILNGLISRIKLIDNNLSLFSLNYSDVGRSQTMQHRSDGTVFHHTINFGTGGDALVDILSKQELNSEKTAELFESFNSTGLPLHDELFSQALMHQDHCNFTSAFYMLNSAYESMLIFYLELFSEASDKKEMLDLFMQGKSRCNSCELFSKSGMDTAPIEAMVPSIFAQIKFLKNVSNISDGLCKELKKLTIKLRSSNIRNDLVHGKTNTIPLEVIRTGFDSYKKIEDILSNLNHN